MCMLIFHSPNHKSPITNIKDTPRAPTYRTLKAACKKLPRKQRSPRVSYIMTVKFG
jgi:hypothetical protein